MNYKKKTSSLSGKGFKRSTKAQEKILGIFSETAKLNTLVAKLNHNENFGIAKSYKEEGNFFHSVFNDKESSLT